MLYAEQAATSADNRVTQALHRVAHARAGDKGSA